MVQHRCPCTVSWATGGLLGLAKCPNWTGAYAGKEHLSLVREGSRGAQGDMVGMAFGWIVFGPCRGRNVAGSSGTETTGDDGHSECPRRACPAPPSTPCGVGVGEKRRSAENAAIARELTGSPVAFALREAG